MTVQTNFNVQISGTSYDSVIDSQSPITVSKGNADKIGHASFTLSNVTSGYYGLLYSGNAMMQIAFNSSIVFRGTVERVDMKLDTTKGLLAEVNCFDYAQELLNCISPDARPTLEEGLNLPDGMDLVAWVSGANLASGARVGDFFSQYFGTSADTAGLSGFTFKKHSGTNSSAIWRSYFNPNDTRDNNYYIQVETMKVTREYAWDTIRRITRGAARVLDGAGNQIALDLYIDTSGAINLLTSGHTNFVASGMVFQLYGLQSGANNNVIRASIPFDLTTVKNVVVGTFPVWSQYPIDGDYFSDTIAYDRNRWSGIGAGGGTLVALSGNSSANTGEGVISIFCVKSGVAGDTRKFIVEMIYEHPTTFDITKWNVAGGIGVNLTYNARVNDDEPPGNLYRYVQIYDSAGNYIIKSGRDTGNQIFQENLWQAGNYIIYTMSGTFYSGNGTQSGWAASATFPDLTKVKQIQFAFDTAAGAGARFRELYIDNLGFSFRYNYFPLSVNNDNSAILYGRRYETFEYPFVVTDGMASGIITNELNSKMGSRGMAEVVVKENKAYSGAQYVNPGQVVRFEAPQLGTGSGFRLHFWKVTDATMQYGHTQGFTTTYKLIPWYSGSLTDPESNLINYSTPPKYDPTAFPHKPTIADLLASYHANKVFTG